VKVWNIGGIKFNAPAFFDSLKSCDVAVFLETFLTEQDEANFQFPSDFFFFTNPGKRDPRKKARRAAGGILVLLRSSVFDAKKCKADRLQSSLLKCSVTPFGCETFKLVAAYRTANSKSPVFDATFFQTLAELCQSSASTGEKVLLLGDFNAKIGDIDSELGSVEEFAFLLPTTSANSTVCPVGRTLLESLSGADFFLVPVFNVEGKYPITCKPNSDRASTTAGSVIDFVFASLAAIPRVVDVGYGFASELSSHAWLEFGMQVLGKDESTRATTPDQGVPRITMSFDVDRVLEIAHTDALVALATDPSSFTVREAYETILDFVSTYTVTRVVQASPNVTPGLHPRLRDIRKRARRIERKIKKCRDVEVRTVLEENLRQVIEVWKAERDAVEDEKRAKIREQFRQARAAGNHHLSWRLAKLNLAGKGGGVKSSATMAISRADWERHFRGVYQSSAGAAAVDNVDVGRATNAALDSIITPEEVTAALEKKKNLRAPGPDGFRVDFLRLVRYDETVTRAIANFFNLVLNGSEVPSEWDSAYLFVLYKGKGDPADANNYRGITLKSQFLKLLESVICNRLTSWFESHQLLPPEQLAYRHGLSGTDHLYMLNVIIEDALARGKVLFIGLIDLCKAFPSVNRQKLLEDLVRVGVSSKTVSLLRRLYSSDNFRLLLDGVPGTVVFCVVVGVHEGSCLSPMLFVFFIRDLSVTLSRLTTNIACPVVGLREIFSMVFADDVNVFSYEQPGTQQLVDGAVDFFLERGLTPNPNKCEFLAVSTRKVNTMFTVQDVTRATQPSARYLGLHFSENGKWDEQLKISISRSRAALGRCKVMVSTVGRHNVKVALELFDSVVASVYRFGMGVWGVNVYQVRKIDGLFADFITWLFRFPHTTGRDAILSNFGRRCAKCDSLYLASVQLAVASTSRNTIWGDAVRDLQGGVLQSKWFTTVRSELGKRGMEDEALVHGPSFVSDRKRKAVEFAQYCFHFHLNTPTGSSSDQIKRVRPFGVFPFLISQSPERSRYVFSFLCSNWRFIDGLRCEIFPDACDDCDQENSSMHVLFVCPSFASARERFLLSVGRPFTFCILASSDRNVHAAICDVGRDIYFEIARRCDSLVLAPATATPRA
jgi:exonuclease III